MHPHEGMLRGVRHISHRDKAVRRRSAIARDLGGDRFNVPVSQGEGDDTSRAVTERHRVLPVRQSYPGEVDVTDDGHDERTPAEAPRSTGAPASGRVKGREAGPALCGG